ncbi:MAG TPA: site-specific integrase [Alphaproteobacteria bacterium]|nr:site-specific integrase [Alphaproteobacteria bacterium]
MPTMNLTAAAIARHKPAPEGKRIEVWDKVLPGFGVRITDAGRKTFFARYVVTGSGREFLPLGPFVEGAANGERGSLSHARAEAGRALDLAKVGTSPKQTRARAGAAAEQATASTYRAVVSDFIEEYAKPRNRGWREVERLLLKEGALWLDRPVASITAVDIVMCLKAVKKRAPIVANRTLAAWRRMFKWAVKQRIYGIVVSPAADLETPSPEVERERVLSEAEIKAVWSALDALGWPFGPIYQLNLVSAQRRGEVASMRWSDIDLGAKVWTLPREATKSGRAHDVPLSDLAVTILDGLPRVGESYVFPSLNPRKRTGTERPVSGFSAAVKRAKKIIAEREAKGEGERVDDWRLHDLRRTATTEMARLGIPEHVLKRVLNHSTRSISGVTGIYNRHEYAEEKRSALAAWGRRLQVILDGKTENVVELAEARA